MSRFGFLGIVGALLLATGCVSSSQHDDLMKKYMEEEAKSRRLAADNAKLTAALHSKKVDPKDIIKDLPPVDTMPPEGGGRPFKPVPGDVELLPKGGMRLGGLNFRSGSAELTEQGKATLDQVAAQLKAKPGFFLVVDGHTDTDPISKSKNASNWELSGKRAAAVLDHLVKDGVCDGKHAYLRGYGEFKPIGTDKAKNRRVEIYAFDAPGLAGGSREVEPVTPTPPPPTRPTPKPAPKGPAPDDPTLK